MLLSSLPDIDGSRCLLTFDKANQWLRATWRGFVDTEEALRGADNYLRFLADVKCPCLPNGNVALRGPWFDSIGWLEQVWAPQARQMGLRHVAHVVQADSLSDTITVNFRSGPQVNGLELQIFQQVPQAEAWLRQCQSEAVGAE